jgi:hypothetical protein
LTAADEILNNLICSVLLEQVRVEAGCRVQQVADALKPYGLTLENYASIREQQIGGYTQVRLIQAHTAALCLQDSMMQLLFVWFQAEPAAIWCGCVWL